MARNARRMESCLGFILADALDGCRDLFHFIPSYVSTFKGEEFSPESQQWPVTAPRRYRVVVETGVWEAGKSFRFENYAIHAPGLWDKLPEDRKLNEYIPVPEKVVNSFLTEIRERVNPPGGRTLPEIYVQRARRFYRGVLNQQTDGEIMVAFKRKMPSEFDFDLGFKVYKNQE